jgi:hypothetical protein
MQFLFTSVQLKYTNNCSFVCETLSIPTFFSTCFIKMSQINSGKQNKENTVEMFKRVLTTIMPDQYRLYPNPAYGPWLFSCVTDIMMYQEQEIIYIRCS